MQGVSHRQGPPTAMSELFITVAGQTDQGRVRTTNQDNYYLDPAGRFFILADGMGGYTGGEIASTLTIQTITQSLARSLEEVYNSIRPPHAWLNQAILYANTQLVADSKAHPQRSDMGTTVVLVLPIKNTLWYAHVGDSRLYRWRESQLQQLTRDHTLVADLVSQGLLAAEEVRRHPYRNMLSRCLGRSDFKEATTNHATLYPGDRLVLCSDGLTEEVTDQEISEILSTFPDNQDACQSLIEQANSRGGHDNITVLVLSVKAS